MDFSKLSDEPEVHFTHNRGFIAKTSCTEISKIKEMLLLARKWLEEICIYQSSSENENLRKKIKDNTFFLPGEAYHTPCTGTNKMDDNIQRMYI